MLNDIFNNPEILRNFRYRLRPKTIILTSILTVALLSFIALLVLAPEHRSFNTTERSYLCLVYLINRLSLCDFPYSYIYHRREGQENIRLSLYDPHIGPDYCHRETHWLNSPSLVYRCYS